MNAIQLYRDQTFAISSPGWSEFTARMDLVKSGAKVDFGNKPRSSPRGDGVAVIPIYGTLLPRPNFVSELFGWLTMEEIVALVRYAASDPGVGTIVLDISSPGGAVAGTPEAGNAIYQARQSGKRIIAVANHLAASAALWLFAQAHEKVASPSAEIGSLGVMAIHTDYSRADEADGIKTTIIKSARYKNEANPFEPLGDEARAEIQRRVNEQHDIFVDAVARGYGISPAAVESNFGQGRMFGAAEAKRRGMIDRVDTLEGTLARVTGSKPVEARRGQKLTAASSDPRIAADLARRRMAV